MKKIFTALCASASVLLMGFPVSGREIIAETPSAPATSPATLYSESQMPDSAITCNINGHRIFKHYPTIQGGFIHFGLINDKWMPTSDPDFAIDFPSSDVMPHVDDHGFVYPAIESATRWTVKALKFSTVTCDAIGNATDIEMVDFYKIKVSYNGDNLPVLIEASVYSSGNPHYRIKYEYDENIHTAHGRTLFQEEMQINNEWVVMNKIERKIENGKVISVKKTQNFLNGGLEYRTREASYDENGRIARIDHSIKGEKDGIVMYENSAYTFFYYSGIIAADGKPPHNGARISISGDLLRINSAASEPIAIYSTTGALLLNTIKPAGETTVDISRLPKIIIIKGAGWVQKSVVR
jgi:hypothetical protein